ncbi:MAG: DUF4236 domain-containing protein [Candidatus Binataceae bacterium]|nr:DUF4236 domain-containing protein [Candidatus Binataceae bacterium]
MGNFRFYRRMKIFPGLSLNLSKSGPSVTVGMRGAHMTFGRTGIRRTIGVPGTGIYYTSHTGSHTGYHSAHTEQPVDADTQVRAERTGSILVGLLILGLVLLLGMAIGAVLGH